MNIIDMFLQAFEDAGLEFQTMLTSAIAYLPRLLAGLLVAIVGWFIARGFRKWAQKLVERLNTPVPVDKLLVGSIYILSLVSVFIIALAAMGIQIYPLIAGLGISGLVIGFALKDIIENLLAGVLLLVQQPFEINDYVDVGGTAGTVTDIQIRSTHMKTPDNIAVIIPNRTVYTSLIKNFNTYTIRRRQISLGIGYREDLRKTSALLLDTVKSIEGVAVDPEPSLVLNDFGESAVLGFLYYFVDTSEHNLLVTQTAVLTALQQLATEMEIDLPYPISIVINR